jgi:hypothetical protein
MTFVLCYHCNHLDPQHSNHGQSSLNVETCVLFRQILKYRIWVVDTRDNLRQGFSLKNRDNMLQRLFSLLDLVCPIDSSQHERGDHDFPRAQFRRK